MPNEEMKSLGQALANLILSTIDEIDPPRGIALKALSYCQSHFENRTVVETAAAVAGCSTTDCLSNDDLELYYDIVKGSKDVAFISKGWDDPGFRLGQIIAVSGDSMERRLEDAKRLCETNGIVMTALKADDSEYEVTMEYVIFATGFDGRTFAQALSTLTECANKLEDQ